MRNYFHCRHHQLSGCIGMREIFFRVIEIVAMLPIKDKKTAIETTTYGSIVARTSDIDLHHWYYEAISLYD